jgi:putative membrane protein
MMYGYGDWGVWGWVVMAIMMLLFWGGLAAIVLLLLRGPRGGWGSGGSGYGPVGLGHDDPERILSQRFARGEIDEAEYKARLGALRHRP